MGGGLGTCGRHTPRGGGGFTCGKGVTTTFAATISATSLASTPPAPTLAPSLAAARPPEAAPDATAFPATALALAEIPAPPPGRLIPSASPAVEGTSTQSAPFAAAAVPACAAAAAATSSVAQSEAATTSDVGARADWRGPTAAAAGEGPKDAALAALEAPTPTPATLALTAGHLLPLRGLPRPGRPQLRPLCHRP